MANKRLSLTGKLTTEAHLAWRSFAARHGVSMSALLEAMGTMLGDGDWDSSAVAELVAVAREVDANRRLRLPIVVPSATSPVPMPVGSSDDHAVGGNGVNTVDRSTGNEDFRSHRQVTPT
jgi:hypothetical protein